jgi:hypothetical protein
MNAVHANGEPSPSVLSMTRFVECSLRLSI